MTALCSGALSAYVTADCSTGTEDTGAGGLRRSKLRQNLIRHCGHPSQSAKNCGMPTQ